MSARPPIDFSAEAFDEIQRLFDDLARTALAERVDEALDELEKSPGEARFRRLGFQHDPILYGFTVAGSGDTWTILWEFTDQGTVFVHYAGDALS